MKPFLSQQMEMEIFEENTHIGLTAMSNQTENLNTFLKENFKFPSNNLSEIGAFINKDMELKKIIYDLPKITMAELEFKQLSLDFMKETDPSEKILEIIIFSSLDERILLQKEEIISDGIIDKYPNTNKEYIILVEPYVDQN